MSIEKMEINNKAERTPDQIRQEAPGKMKELWALVALKAGLIKDELLSNVKAAKKTVAEHPYETAAGVVVGTGIGLGAASYLEGTPPQHPSKAEVVGEFEQGLEERTKLAKELREELIKKGAKPKEVETNKDNITPEKPM